MSPAPAERSLEFPHRREDLQEQRVGEDLMVYDPRARKVHILNRTAALIYRFCDGEHDFESLERELREGFELPQGRNVRSDIRDAIQSLREKGLLR
jgi:PqqD family protein of HPr-rel-A system